LECTANISPGRGLRVDELIAGIGDANRCMNVALLHIRSLMLIILNRDCNGEATEHVRHVSYDV
jgi:hypothetical protein